MITDKARELAQLARGNAEQNPLENLPEKAKAHEDLLQELRTHCRPTLEEFLELAGDLVYKPEKYWSAIWGNQ